MAQESSVTCSFSNFANMGEIEELHSWRKSRYRRCFFAHREYDGLIEIAFDEQRCQELAPTLIQDIRAIKEDESNTCHECQSSLKRDAESKAL